MLNNESEDPLNHSIFWNSVEFLWSLQRDWKKN